MNARNATVISRMVALVALAAGMWAATACTVIRYVDENNASTDGPPPKVVDMLVMMDLSRGTANLTQDYANIVGTVVFVLGEQNVEVRKAALAPLYSRAEGTVPILYGEDDPNGEFRGFGDAIAFYTYDDGAQYLQDAVTSDSANPATLGAELDRRSVYHPVTADPTAAAYFTEPADGFVVLYLSASARRCSASDGACSVDGMPAVDHFTRTDDAGVAWLNFPGGTSLPPDKVFHGAIVTAENADYDAFYETCSSYPNFPMAHLDVMEPSERHAYFGPLIEGIEAAGGNGHFVDLCEAMSSRSEAVLLGLAAGIRSML